MNDFKQYLAAELAKLNPSAAPLRIQIHDGVVNLFTTESRAAFNRFVCNYVNTK